MIKDLIKQIETIKEQLYSKILSLPENNEITTITESPKCFTIPFSKVIGKPLSPEYYCYKKQYHMIVDNLTMCKIEKFDDTLKTIVDTGIVKYGVSNTAIILGTRTFRLNPEVINYLKSIL